MNQQVVDYILFKNLMLSIEVISAVLSIIFMSYYWKRCEKTPFLICYTLYQLLLVLTIITHLIIHMASVIDISWEKFYYFKHVFYGYVIFFWILLCFIHMDEKKQLNRKLLFIIIVPTIFAALISTNDMHHLLFGFKISTVPTIYISQTDKTWLYYCFAILGNCAVLFVEMKMLFYLAKQNRSVKLQTLLLIFMMLVQQFTNLYAVLKPGNFDMTPASTLFSSIFFAVSAFKYRIIHLIPIAFKEFVENMKTAILLLDKNNRVIYYNKVFKEAFPALADIEKYADVKEVFNRLESLSVKKEEVRNIKEMIASSELVQHSVELNISNHEGKCYLAALQHVIAYKNENVGKIISFSDITAYKNLLVSLDKKNILLTEAYEKLKEHADTVEELAVVKERTRLTRETHDTIGQTMVVVNTLLNTSVIYFDQEPAKAKEDLKQAATVLKKGFQELRSCIHNIDHTEASDEEYLEKLKDMVNSFIRAGVNVELTIQGNTSLKDAAYWKLLYRACQESLTNSQKHGRAKNVNIILQFFEECIRLYILDDGCGCKSIEEGMGLSGMSYRVKELGGNVIFASDGVSGFNISIEIPLI